MISPHAQEEPDVRAAGAVVFRGLGAQRQVLVEHRPGYDDWTLPKGKPHHDEYLPATAVREVEEETGVHVRLGRPLPCLAYEVGSGHKRVWWWLGEQRGEMNPEHDDEADVLAWPTLEKAREMLDYPDEAELLDVAAELAERPRGATILLVRHAKARSRKSWKHADLKRPLAARGHRQAEALVELFTAFGATAIVSSPSARCRQTVHPLARHLDIEPELVELLSEEGADGHSQQVVEFMAQLRARAVADPEHPLVVCGHRPVLPDMQKGLGLPESSMSPAQCLVVHLDENAEPLAVDSFPSLL